MNTITNDESIALTPSATPARAGRRRPPAALGKLTMGALAGLALALGYVQVGIIGELAPNLTVFAGLLLLAAGLIATGWRWAPLVGALLSIYMVAGNGKTVLYDLTHPETFNLFVFMVVAVALAAVGAAAGVGATVQNYRGGARIAPRWTSGALAALVALATGAVLVGGLPRAAAGVSEEVLAGLPALTTPDFHFDQKELRVKAGETVALRLDNPHIAPHSFDIDELNVHVPVAVGKSSLILFKPARPGTYTFYCQLPGHREEGMEGTLVVEP